MRALPGTPMRASGAVQYGTVYCGRFWRRWGCGWAKRWDFNIEIGTPAAVTPFIEVVPRDDPHWARVKGGGSRRVYVSDELDRLDGEHLWQLCAQGADLAVADLDAAPVFVNLAREPRFARWRPESVYDLVDKLRRQLADRVPREWTPHWLRHSHATAFAIGGGGARGQPSAWPRRCSDNAEPLCAVTEDAAMRSAAQWKALTASWRTAGETAEIGSGS